MVNRNTNNKINPKIKIFIRTQVLLISLSTVSLLAVSLAVYSINDISFNLYFYLINASLAVSDFVSGFYSGIKLKKNGMLNAGLYCLPVNLFFVLISVFLNNFNIDLTLIFSIIILLSSSMLGGILSVNIKSNSKRVGR